MKKTPIAIMLCLLMAQQGFSQADKLKNVQESSLQPPVNVKVDGNLKEWNDKFEAYNKATKLYYTLSNDDNFLYLVVKSTDAINNNKIAAGGITLIVNTEGKKKDKDAFSITYPVVTRRFGGPGGGGPGGPPGGFGGDRGPGGFGGDRNRNPGQDSAFIAAQHKQTLAAAKEIKVAGFKSITDSMISVYNEYGVKAAIGYDAAGNYDYELAIPLKLLNLSTDNAKEFAYDIKVNGLSGMPFGDRRPDGGGGPGGGGPPGGGVGIVTSDGGVRGGPPGGGGGDAVRFGGPPPGMQEMLSPTDFWGKYILAKK